jgi:hypothetical protein
LEGAQLHLDFIVAKEQVEEVEGYSEDEESKAALCLRKLTDGYQGT